MKRLAVEGLLVNHDGEFEGRVEIDKETGLIESVGSARGEADIASQNYLIFPGFVDVHVHAREDASCAQLYKEDFHTASQAAIHGGVAHIADMPNNPVPPVDEASYQEKKALAKSSLVDVTLYAGIGPETEPLAFEVPYKVFMGPSIGDAFFASRRQLENALKRYAGRSVSFHCEDAEILERHAAETLHERQRPREAEIRAIDFALRLIETYGLKGKLCHCSTKEGIARIRDAKKRGLEVTCEVTPSHLYFDETMLDSSNRPFLRVNPPLRSAEDRVQLIEALRDGTIDYLASDHAPHTKEEKLKGVSGIPHLDTYGAFTTWLMEEHNFSPQDIARVCSWNPGEFVNQFLWKGYGQGFGKIERGYVGSLTIIDPDTLTAPAKENLKTKCGWSPFEGMEFPGSVRYTIVKGKVYGEQ